MYKTKNKFTNNSTSQEKRLPPKPRPQFSTDFVDREKYKLSESEMIQKKAALQSKHREEAIQSLQQRRKKLEMGIVDDDTRKVYETALTSKKIDINPSIRRNLSQMIQYEREQKGSLKKDSRSEHREAASEEQDSSDNEQNEKQLKQTQAFIKKFEKAKKMDNIERAVNILAEPQAKHTLPSRNSAKKVTSREKIKEKPVFENARLTNKVLDLRESTTSLDTSTHEEVLSSIEDTIKFMQERLFSTTRKDKIKKEKQQESTSKDFNQTGSLKTQGIYQSSYSDLPCKTNQSYDDNSFSRHPFEKETLQISHLKMKNEESEEQVECLDTIRRMKDMINSKTYLPEPSFKKNMKENVDYVNIVKPQLQDYSTLQKNTPLYTDSEAQIDFSLTMNNSLEHSLEQSQKRSQRTPQNEYFSGKFGGKDQKNYQNDDDQYERIKKSLFEEVNKLQMHSLNNSEEPSFQAKTCAQDKPAVMMDESSISNLRYNPTPSTNKKSQKQPNLELQKLRNEINGTKNIVESIRVQTLQLPKSNQIIGLDFRGSINIKKNVMR